MRFPARETPTGQVSHRSMPLGVLQTRRLTHGTAPLTDERRTNDQDLTAVAGDQAFDLLLLV